MRLLTSLGSRDRLRESLERIRPFFFSRRSGRSVVRYNEDRSEISNFLASVRHAFWGLAVFSGLSNVLMLTGSFFMLQVYDRVLPSRSIPTLLGLLGLAIILYIFQGALDLVRTRLSGRVVIVVAVLLTGVIVWFGCAALGPWVQP